MGRSPATGTPARLGVFIDYRFRRDDGGVTVERAFALFLLALEPHVGRLTLIGRLDPRPDPFPYALPASVAFTGLSYYESLRRPLRAAPALARSLRALWQSLDDLDVVWTLGPNPLAIALAAMGLLRGRWVVLGVRQDTPRYVRSRHPRRRALWLAADAMQAAFRVLAVRSPVVVVGAELAGPYRHAPATHVLHVSLVPEHQVLAEDPPARATFGGRLISVGRLDTEKNPLLLADVLAELVAGGGPWSLDVYGDGPLAGALEARLAELGVGGHATLHGYAAADGELVAAYRRADALVHISWTEGVPQVLIEGFAARLPTVATAVGGVAALCGTAALLVPPGDGPAVARAVRRLADEPELRGRLANEAEGVARAHTMERETTQIAAFLGAGG